MTSPILFLIFNRPDTTQRVFEEIRKARPPRLYVAADGPRQSRIGEKKLCEQARAIIYKVDWPCAVKTLFRDENLGCGKAVSQAITWFFDHEEEGIILEDDILPHPDFFPYCDELLEKYRDDDTVGIISGHNSVGYPLNRETTYGFFTIPRIWGWATWRDRWYKYDYDLKNVKWSDLRQSLQTVGFTPDMIRFWKMIYLEMKDHRINTWDFQWSIILMADGKINPTPYSNITKNIGFDDRATHTTAADLNEESIELKPIYPISHPLKFITDCEADRAEANKINASMGRYAFAKYQIKRLIKRLIGR